MKEHRLDPKELKLIFKQKRPNKFAIVVLLLLTLFTMIFPILVIINDGLNINTILILVFFGIMAVYFLRLYLWNSQGQERLIINDALIKHELDYGLFIDKNEMDNSEILVALINDRITASTKKIETEVIDNPIDTETEKAEVVLKQKDNTTIKVNTKLSSSEFRQLLAALHLAS